ncbi:MAG: hypothetical protein K0R43_4305 [Pseudoduganella sp.]|nr:hypothetical protein [Pseudoduganella sp.]
MLKRNFYIAVICTALSACGGGGGGASTTTLPDSSSKPAALTAVAWSVGDTFTHTSTTTITVDGTTSSPETLLYTDVVTSIQVDGGATVRRVFSDSNTYADLVYDSERRLMSTHTNLGACKSEYMPARRSFLPNPVSVGTTWDVATKLTTVCDGTTTETQYSIKYTVVAQESLTLPIGTFNALKVVSSTTSETPTSTAKREITCWFDPQLNVELKCEGASTRTSKSTGKVLFSWTNASALQGYSSAKARRQFDTVSRFAGEWSGGYSGSGIPATVCTVTIDTSGGFQGKCGTITVAGTIAADGTMTFKLSEFGQTGPAFTGKFESPLSIKGTFTVPGGSGGTWTLVHM